MSNVASQLYKKRELKGQGEVWIKYVYICLYQNTATGLLQTLVCFDPNRPDLSSHLYVKFLLLQ